MRRSVTEYRAQICRPRAVSFCADRLPGEGRGGNILVVPIGGGGEGLARAQADLVRVRARDGEVHRPAWVYAALALVIAIPLALFFVLATLLT
jgi:hypothetical protein